MLARLRRRLRREDGAIAVMFALLGVVIIGSAAIAVDLGNAMSRRVIVQKQADLAALAGGAGLPDAAAARTLATDYLLRNEVLGGAASGWTSAQFDDDVLANGEIDIVGDGTRIEVTAPPARVDFGLAGIFGSGGTDVQARAVAEIASPGSMAPFFVPAGCAYQGPGGTLTGGAIDIKAGSQASPDDAPDDFATPQAARQTIELQSLDPVKVQWRASPRPRITVSGQGFTASGMWIAFSHKSQEIQKNAITDLGGTVVLGTRSRDPDLLQDIELPPAVVGQDGTWWIQVGVDGVDAGPDADYWSEPDVQNSTLAVLINANAPEDCGVKSTGDFGFLNSPRSADTGENVNQKLTRLKLNIATGIDHPIQVFAGALANPAIPEGTKENCQTGSTLVPGAILDDAANLAGGNTPNCLDVFNGNKVDVLGDSLVTGVGSVPGRLDQATSSYRTQGCSPSDDTSSGSVLSRSVNNDVPSCYLNSTSLTLGSALGSAPRQGQEYPPLDGAIVDSPRFFMVPVIKSVVNPQNGWFAITDFMGAFITNESTTAALGSSNASGGNGLSTSSNKLSYLRVVYFRLDAMPDLVVSDGETSPYIGTGPKVVRLVE